MSTINGDNYTFKKLALNNLNGKFALSHIPWKTLCTVIPLQYSLYYRPSFVVIPINPSLSLSLSHTQWFQSY